MRTYLLFFVVAFSLSFFSVSAQTSPPGKANSSEEVASEVEKAIKALGSGKSKARKNAYKKLLKLGDAAVPALEKLAKSDDPELKVQASELLLTITTGLGADASDELKEDIETYGTVDRFEKLAMLKKFIKDDKDDGPKLALGLIAYENDPKVAEYLSKELYGTMVRAAQIAISKGDQAFAERALLTLMKSKQSDAARHYAAIKLVEGTLDEVIPEVFKTIDSPVQRMLLERAQGDRKKVVKYLDEEDLNSYVRKQLCVELGEWDRLAEVYEELAGPSADIEVLAYLSGAYRLSGNKTAYDKQIKAIEAYGLREEDEIWFAAEALLLNDEFDRAIAMLAKKDEPSSAVLAYQLSDYDIVVDVAKSVLSELEDGELPNGPQEQMKYYLDRVRGNWQPEKPEKTEDGEPMVMPTEENPFQIDKATYNRMPKENQLAFDINRAFFEGKYEKVTKLAKPAMKEYPNAYLTLYLWGWAEEKLGEKEAGAEKMRQAELAPMAVSSMRLQLIRTLKIQKAEQEKIDRQIDLILRTDLPDSEQVADVLRDYAAPAAMEAGKFREAEEMLERSRLQLMRKRSNLYNPAQYLTLTFNVWDAKVRQLLADDKEEEAIAMLPAMVKLLPNFGEDMVRALWEDHRGFCDAYFDATHEHLIPLLKTYPNSGELYNKVAWQIALSQRRMKLGRKLAKKACTLIPNYAPPMDTLAETLFQLGEVEKALRWEKKALKLMPEESFFKRQIERFKKGDTKSFPK